MYYDVPDVDPRLIGWIIKYAKRNYWKVQSFMEMEDLIHEGFDCIYHARNKYPDRIADPAKFSNTVKLIFANWIPELLNRNIRMPEGSLTLIGDMVAPEREMAFAEMLIGQDESDGISKIVAEAPELIKPILKAFQDPKSSLPDFLRRQKRYRLNGHTETLNERLCTFIGVDPTKFNICQQIRDYLGAEV